MTTAQSHYESFLADHYTWMYAISFEEKVAEQAALLARAGVDSPGVALDLGCGPGFQAFALASLGAARVLAVDTSRQLLDELESRAAQIAIEIFHRDLLEFPSCASTPLDTIVCMGDTLTHLNRREDVGRLFAKVGDALDPGGRFVFSYRDLSTTPTGVDRFISLRSEADKIMTCFIERVGDRVMIHDLLHVRRHGEWTLRKSAYPKLVLPLTELEEELSECGLQLDFHDCDRGMHTLGLIRH